MSGKHRRGKKTESRLAASSSRQDTVALAMAVALAVVAYANALGNRFALDDIGIIVENPIVRSVGDLRTIFTRPYWPGGATGASADPALYRPFTVLTYAIDFALWDLNASAFHAVNVVLHAVTTGLVFYLALGLIGSTAGALAAAAIFAVHPLHTEAVTGIVGRAELLAALCFLSAFLVLRRRSSPTLVQGACGAAIWLLGLLSKEIAATLPVVLAVDDWVHRSEFPADRSSRIRLLAVRYAPLLLAAVVYLLMRENAISGAPRIWPGWMNVPPLDRVLTASRVMMEYLWLFVFPRRLLADYWTTEVPIASSLGAPAVLASLALWVGIGLLLFRSVRREHRLVLPLAWFLITMAPVSNVLFPIGVAKAERLMYLPSVGLCILVGWAFVRAEHKTRVIGRETLAALLAVVTWRTVDRNRDWKDSLTIALATLEESPGSLLMNDIAAGEYVKRGEPQKAVPLLQEAARQAPYMAFVHTHLGTTYSMLGMYDQAIDAFREALRLNPSDADARNNLGIAYDLTSREDLAIEEFRAAIAIRPGFADPHMNLGLLHLERGQLSDAVTELSEAARLNPASADVQNNLGLALSRDNQLERAAEHYREALRLNPNHAMARANLERLQVQRRPP